MDSGAVAVVGVLSGPVGPEILPMPEKMSI